MGTATESAIGNKGNGFTQASANDGRRRLQHFRHAGPTFWPYIAYHHHITGLHFSGADTGNEFELSVEYLRRAFKTITFFSADLGHASAFGKVSVQYLQMA